MRYGIALIFLSSFIVGSLAFLIGAPMPYMMGGIVGAAGFVLYAERDGQTLPKLSPWVRMSFAAIIGSMIGARFTPELLAVLPDFWVSGLAVIPFILIAHAGNYLIMHRLGGYRKLDAYFAGLPGGIVDSVILAEQAGADTRVVTVQHFIRIILVVITVPLLFWFSTGQAVGSLAGETLAGDNSGIRDLVLIIGLALIGLFAGRALKLPVAHLMGPLLLALALTVNGVVVINTPPWLIHVAQYMIGTSLGAQFSGISRKMLMRGLHMGILSGAYMLLLCLGFALFLAPLVPVGVPAMFISYAPGGLAEMSLIALSLNISPLVVALHHLARIFLTIWIGNLIFKYALKRRGGV